MTDQNNDLRPDLGKAMTDETKKPEPDIVFYGINDPERLEYEDDDEAIEAYLDDLYPDDLPETIELCGYARREIKPEFLSDSLLGSALEGLDEEFGDPDGNHTKPTQNMKDAEKVFIEAILAEYEPWMCECVSREEINVKEWVEKNAPHWLKEKLDKQKRMSYPKEEIPISLPPEMLGIWRCSCCGIECDASLMGGSWRWEGSRYGHHCENNIFELHIPQAGHFPCERVEPVEEVKS